MDAMPRLFAAGRDVPGPRLSPTTLLSMLDGAGTCRSECAFDAEGPDFDDALWDVLAAYAISSAPWRSIVPVNPSALPRPLDSSPGTSLLEIGLRLQSRAMAVDMERPGLATLKQFRRGIVVGDAPADLFRVHEIATRLPDGSVVRLPAPSDLKGIIKRFFASYHAGNRGIAATFALGVAIVAVHPFADGNGRTTRSLVYRLLRDLHGLPAAALNIAFFFQSSRRFWKIAFPQLLHGNFDAFDALVAAASAGAQKILGEMRMAQRLFDELRMRKREAVPTRLCGDISSGPGGRPFAAEAVSGRKSESSDFLLKACGDFLVKPAGLVNPAAVSAMDVMTPSIYRSL